MIKPWFEYHRVSDDEYEIENEIVPGEIDEDPLRLPDYFVDFMQKLDGKTNPYMRYQLHYSCKDKRYVQN